MSRPLTHHVLGDRDALLPTAGLAGLDHLHLQRIGAVGDRDIAVTIEETSPTERAELFASAVGFSARERELLSHHMTRTDTRQVAGLMFLSEHTVRDHLKSIFAKTATHNRPTLLSRALGT